MALPSTLHHFDLRFAHADRGVDGAVALKVARHPSETMERERGLARALAADLAAIDGAVLTELARIDARRIAVVATIVADHLYLEVDGRSLDGPLHRASG